MLSRYKVGAVRLIVMVQGRWVLSVLLSRYKVGDVRLIVMVQGRHYQTYGTR